MEEAIPIAGMAADEELEDAVVAALQAVLPVSPEVAWNAAQEDEEAKFAAGKPDAEVDGTGFVGQQGGRQGVEADRVAEETAGGGGEGGDRPGRRMLVPEESEASARPQVTERAARDVVGDDGDAVTRAEGAKEAVGPGSGEGASRPEEGDPEPRERRGLSFPVVKMGRQQHRGAAAQAFQTSEGPGRQVGPGKATEKQGKNVPEEVETEFPAKKQGFGDPDEVKVASNDVLAKGKKGEKGDEEEGKAVPST